MILFFSRFIVISAGCILPTSLRKFVSSSQIDGRCDAFFFFHFSFSSFCIVVASDSEIAYNENLVFADLFLFIGHSFSFLFAI